MFEKTNVDKSQTIQNNSSLMTYRKEGPKGGKSAVSPIAEKDRLCVCVCVHVCGCGGGAGWSESLRDDR